MRFRFAFPKPPPAASGRAYRTLDERCEACQVMGGHEPPCQPAGILRAIEEDTGFPCPRRESENVDDGVCLELLGVATSPAIGTMYHSWQALVLKGMPEEIQLRLMRRVAAASADKGIAEHLPRRLL